MKTLVAGWFSFPRMGASAGDLLTKDEVCRWLDQAGQQYDVALATPFTGGVDWTSVDPSMYSDVVFVCGPFGNGWPIPDFLERFAGKRLLGVNLSMLEPLERWNPFNTLFERDSSRCVRPDVALSAPTVKVPVIGIVLVHRQTEYEHGLHDAVHAAVDRLIASTRVATVAIDTRLDANATGLRTPEEVESVISRMDALVTTRLHGLVLGIKNGTPPVAIDPIRGGAKIARQARILGWPVVMADSLTDTGLAGALEWALSARARALTAECGRRALAQLNDVREEFISTFAAGRISR